MALSSSSSSPSSAFPFGTVVVTSPSFSGTAATTTVNSGGGSGGGRGGGRGGPLAHLASTLPPYVRVLGTSDPYGARCGSGGGTIAALDYADAASAASAAASCEHANDGGKGTHATSTADHNTDPPSVLIVHAGGESSRCPTQMVLGKAWSSLPVAAPSSTSSSSAGDDHDQMQSSNTAPAAAAAAAPTPQNPTALLVSELSTLLRDLPRGSVVVAASDVLLGLPRGISFDFSTTSSSNTGTSSTSSSGTSPHRSSSSSRDSVIGLAVPAPLHTAKNHGVYVLEPYLEHVHDDDRLNLSEHDGDGGGTCKDGGGDNGNGGGGDIGGESNCKDGTGSNDSGNMCKRRKVMAASDNAQEGVDAGASTDARQNMLRARTVTKFLQKPSPELMKATHHCTFGDDLSYEGTGGDANSANSTTSNAKHDGASTYGETAQNTEQECAWIDTGVVAFLPEAAAQLRALARGALRCCTHRGLLAMYQEEGETGGSGSSTMEEYAKSHTVKVELYTHLMLALSTSTSTTIDADAVVASDAGVRQHEGLRAYLDEHTTSKISPALLTEIYSRLSILPFRAAAVPAGRFVHLGTTSELLEFLICGSCSSEASVDGNTSTASIASRETTRAAWEEVDAGRRSLGHKIGLRGRFNSFCFGAEPGNDDNIMLGSIIVSLDPAHTGRIGSGTVVEHSSLRCPHLVIGNNCLVSGIRGTSTEPVVIPDGMCFQMMPLHPTWASSAGAGVATGDESAAVSDVNGKDYVFMYLAVEDPIKDASRIYGLSIDRLLKLTKLEESDLWDGSIERSKRMLWNAKIHPVLRLECSSDCASNLGLNLQPLQWISFLLAFGREGREDSTTLSKEARASLDLWKSLPRLSLSEVRNLADPDAEFAFRANVNDTGVAEAKSHHLNAVQDIMFDREHVQTDFRYAVDLFASHRSVDGIVSEALSCLDRIVLISMKDGDLDIAGRSFIVISSLLSDLAKKVEEKSSLLPNKEHWQTQIDAMRFLCSGSNQENRVDIAQTLITLRNQAFSSFSLCRNLLTFLSTNYEQAAFALTEVCVRSSASASAASSSRRGGNLDNGDDDTDMAAPANAPLPAGTWAIATAPARIDLQGGWSDTPPISYEHGGAVAGLAVNIDGKRPLSARCRILASARGITLKSEGRDLKRAHRSADDDGTNKGKPS